MGARVDGPNTRAIFEAGLKRSGGVPKRNSHPLTGTENIGELHGTHGDLGETWIPTGEPLRACAFGKVALMPQGGSVGSPLMLEHGIGEGCGGACRREDACGIKINGC